MEGDSNCEDGYSGDNAYRLAAEPGGITAALQEALRYGDSAAFRTLYHHYGNSVRRFLKILTGSEPVSCELTQQVFDTLWDRREQIASDRDIKEYLYRISRDVAIAYLRQ